MKTRLITLAAIAALISLPAIHAQDEGKHKGKNPMALDKNGDGFVSKEEFLASPKAQEDMAKAESQFAKLDANNDGKISAEEFKAGAPKGKKGGGKKEKKGEE